MTDPWFETGEFVEKRSETTSRFFTHLSGLLSQYEDGTLPEATIIVSHVEVLWKLVEKFNLFTSVSYCEPIVIHFCEGDEGKIEVSSLFKGSSIAYTLDNIYEFFNKHFYN